MAAKGLSYSFEIGPDEDIPRLVPDQVCRNAGNLIRQFVAECEKNTED